MIGCEQSFERIRRHRRWSGRAVLATIVVCAVCALLAAQVEGAVSTWVAAPADMYWGTPGNWDPVGVPNTADADVVFVYSSVTTLTLNNPTGTSDRTVKSITFAGSSSFTINAGGVLWVRSSDAVHVQSGSPGQTFNVNFRPNIGGTHNFNIVNDGTGLLTFAGHITSNPNCNATLVFDGSGDVRVSRLDRRWANETTNVHVVKNGPATLTITGANSSPGNATTTGASAGTTTINQGTISIDAENRLGRDPGGYYTSGGDFVPGAFNPAALTLNGGTLRATAGFA
ncbi:MAG: hypothetical protein RBS80_25320, partial [Thermoguttaceae bacterium]|nr:hypothetical protein [Thermoguttaceae bacterium]